MSDNEEGTMFDLDVCNVAEPQSVPAGEYEVTLIALRGGESDSGFKYLRGTFAINGEGAAAPVGHFLPVPTDDQEPAAQYQNQLKLARFASALDIDPANVHGDGLEKIGNTTRAILKVVNAQEGYGDDNGKENQISRFINAG